MAFDGLGTGDGMEDIGFKFHDVYVFCWHASG